MINPDLNNVQVGTVGEMLVQYKLARWGEESAMVGQGNPYDLIVIRDRPIRIQVKSVQRLQGASYPFVVKRGNNATRRQYTEGEFDMLAFVALDLERVLFMPHFDGQAKRIRPEKFTTEAERQTWLDMVDKLSG